MNYVLEKLKGWGGIEKIAFSFYLICILASNNWQLESPHFHSNWFSAGKTGMKTFLLKINDEEFIR